jgi:hypothetical protein
MSIIKHVTLQKIVAHDFQYNPEYFRELKKVVGFISFLKLMKFQLGKNNK